MFLCVLCGLCVHRRDGRDRSRTASSRTRRDDTNRPSAGAPMRSCPISAPRRASSVESCSGVGCARVNSVCCRTRPGVGSMTIVTRSMAAGGGCDSRSSSRSVRSVRTSRIGDGSCRWRSCRPAVDACPERRRDQPKLEVQDRRAAVAPLEARRQRLEQPRQHERQRLEPLDRPFELERRFEALLGQRRHERRRVLAARDRLPGQRVLPEPRRQIGGRQRRELAQRSDPPAFATQRPQRPQSLSDPDLSASSASSASMIVNLFENRRSGAARAPRALCPGSTTVRPGRASASTSAAVRVAATATCTCTPRAAASRRSSSPIARGGPSRPLEPADVDRHEIVAMPLVARRKFPRDGHERRPRHSPQSPLKRRVFRIRMSLRALRDSAVDRLRQRQVVDTGTRTSSWTPRTRANDVGLDVEPVEQPRLSDLPAPPARSRPPALLNRTVIPAAAARHRLVADEHAGRLAAFDDALQPQPRRERQPPERVRRRLGGVEHDEAEVAGLQHERERLDRLLERALIQVAAQARIGHDLARGSTAAGRDRRRPPPPTRRRTCRAHRRARRARCRAGRRGQHLQQQARAARRSRADELRQLAARKPAAQPRV